MSTTQVGRDSRRTGCRPRSPCISTCPRLRSTSTPSGVQEGHRRAEGPLVCRTGAHTGRSPNDKFVVKEPSSEAHVWWGKVNKPMQLAHFDALRRDVVAHLKSQELFVQDLYAGADPDYRLPVRFIHELAWQNLFVRNLFIVPPAADLAGFQPQFTVLTAPSFKADPARHGTRSDVVIAREPRVARDPDLRHQLRRREQEVDLHGAQLRAAAAGRPVDALLGQHRRRPATRRSSSGCRAPARRRSRAIRSAG